MKYFTCLAMKRGQNKYDVMMEFQGDLSDAVDSAKKLAKRSGFLYWAVTDKLNNLISQGVNYEARS